MAQVVARERRCSVDGPVRGAAWIVGWEGMELSSHVSGRLNRDLHTGFKAFIVPLGYQRVELKDSGN